MNNDFEQQFSQNLRSTPAQPATQSGGGSKFPLVVTLALGAITFLETIVLLITLTNYFSYVTDDDAPEDDFYAEDIDDGNFKYDSNYNIIAFEDTCRNENGSYYTFSSDNKYRFFDSSSNPTDSGTYTLARESIISLNGGSQDKTLYYGESFVADGTVIYECQIEESESTE